MISKLLCSVAIVMVAGAAHAGALSPDDIDAIGRTVYAEAGSETDAGKAAVVFTILNRYVSGGYGPTIQAVIEAKHQFEPVTRAGGWRNLPAMTPPQRARIETIVGFALSGNLADVSGGATHFQNERIVAERARAGTVKGVLVGFNGMPVSARIGGHTFYSRSGAPVDAGETMFLQADADPSETRFLK